jgi:hypothetical protein
MMGFEGTSVTDQVKVLIEKYHVGSILLKAQNLKCTVVLLLACSQNIAFRRDKADLRD